jgi:hypothetical protein
MAINIIQGYNPSTTEPIDSRLVKNNATARYAMQAFEVYEGLLVYQKDTNELYMLVDTGSVGSEAGWISLSTVTGDFATTGSNQFNGNQIITGSVFINGGGQFTGSFLFTGSVSLPKTNNLPASTTIGSVFVSGSELFIYI